MAEAAGVALGVAALFDTCIEGFKIVFAAQEFAKDFEVLSTSFQQQRLRFLLWGESVGLVSRQASTSRQYLEELDKGYVRSTVLKSLASIQYLLQQFKIYESRYGFKNDATLSLVNVSGLRAVDNRFVVPTRRNQKQKSLKAVTRWAVFDAERMRETTERLKALVDGLVDIKDGITRLRTKTRTAGNRHPGLAPMTSGIHIFETTDFRSIENNNTSSICSRQIQALDLQGSIDTFFSAQSFVSPAIHDSIKEDHAIDTPTIENIPTPTRPRSRESQLSAGTYSSTDTSSDESDLDTGALPRPISLYQSTYGNCPSPWTIEDMSESTPRNFADLFPSSKPLYICHDSTTLDGNMNLRVFSDIASTTRGQADYISLFHLRMYDLVDRKFSLRRYCRDSGREVCSSILSNGGSLRLRSKTRSKSRFSFSMSSKRTSRAGSAHSESEDNARETKGDMGSSKGSRTSLSSWFRRRGSRSSHASSASGNDASDCDGDDNSINVAATRVSGNKIALEFSNYAHVDVVRNGTWLKKYTFDYWGHAYEWRRTSSKIGLESRKSWYHSFHLYRKDGGREPIVSITPEDINSLESDYFTNGAWVPPCKMRFLGNEILDGAGDIADVVFATGVVALVDNAIRSGHTPLQLLI